MTPKEKAKELFKKMYHNVSDDVIIQRNDIELWKNTFKQCALIAVDEMIEHSRNISMIYDLSFDDSKSFFSKVKQEIERL